MAVADRSAIPPVAILIRSLLGVTERARSCPTERLHEPEDRGAIRDNRDPL
jgi:hypothetical protein